MTAFGAAVTTKWLSKVISGPPIAAVWLPTRTLVAPTAAVIVNEAIVPMTTGVLGTALVVCCLSVAAGTSGTPSNFDAEVEVDCTLAFEVGVGSGEVVNVVLEVDVEVEVLVVVEVEDEGVTFG